MASSFGANAGPSSSKSTGVLFGNSPSDPSLTSSISNSSQVQFRPHGVDTGMLFGNPPSNPWPSNPISNVKKPQFRPPGPQNTEPQQVHQRHPPGPVSMAPQQVHQRQTQWINPSLPRQSNQAKSPFSHGSVEKGENISSESPMRSLNYNAAKRIKSPHLPSGNSHNLRSPHFPSGDSKNFKSSPLPKGSSPHSLGYHPTSIDYKRSDASPSRLGNIRNPPFANDSSPPQQRSRPVDYSDLHDEGTLAPPKPISATPPKRSRSPVVMLNSSHVQRNSEIILRGDSSPPQQRSRLDVYSDLADVPPKRNRSPPVVMNSSHVQQNIEIVPRGNSSLPQQRSHLAVYSDVDDAGTLHPSNSNSVTQFKRTRSPPAAAVTLSSSPIQNDTESEEQAKARRLARFNIELGPPKVHDYDLSSNKSSQYQHNSSLKKSEADGSTDRTKVLGNIDDSINDDHLESHARLIGLCPDMCPESEREERERKGDLDKYERLDGDRNQTNKFLAVKKYNRTAEREPALIRPMPVLQKTVDYLLNLLNQPYDENFLSLYNFLWDRMRAIRMDLRMQHIFNQQSIIMLEQMIRLHIIAMHELCEYNKGEGFSEGFDAHLNIEQMNKTSVELFQIYDDHRKKGITVPTEKEFRGYYALLKLDKHPGYKVEPAELSMDLAKMPSDIRCSREILFARDVARASRIGNYISFFRLARKATYLEACLMHAHFAKLRTHALASLHSGLQNNQGIPVKQVVYWLGMEDEDILSLLKYHGFGLKEYEEIYMVKEGPLLNSEVDFTTMRSPLVDMKKEERVIDDIYSGPSISHLNEDIQARSDVTGMVDHISDAHKAELSLKISDEFKYDPAVKVDSVPQFKKPPEMESLPYLNGSANVHNEKHYDYRSFSPRKTNFASPFSTMLEVHPSPFLNNADVTKNFLQRSFSINDSVNYQEQDGNEETVASFQKDEETIALEDSSIDKAIGLESEVDMVQAEASVMPQCNSIPVEPAPLMVEDEHLDNEVQMLVLPQKNEISTEKLKAILRKWKLQATKQRETREARILLANEALSSLSLGPPVRPSHTHPRQAQDKLNIDYVARQRYERRYKSWSTLNASKVVGPILSERQPYAKCICWKLLVLDQVVDEPQNSYLAASKWLFSKLLGSPKENEKPIIYHPYLSIWKWTGGTGSDTKKTCCLAVTRVAMFNDNEQVSEDVIAGTTSIIFLVSESIPWATQRMRLQNLLSAIPSGSNLPLIVASADYYNEEVADPPLAISSKLGLQNADKTKVNSFSVMFLYSNSPLEQHNGFFNDDTLRESLQWLANHSPPQPAIHLMKTREVALSFLRYSQEQLENMDVSQVSPNGCISTFNEALDRVVEGILAAASLNPNNWPGPEIDLLDKSHDEEISMVDSLPHIGWSLDIQPVIDAIMGCKLPEFSFDISWLDQGSQMELEIINGRHSLEECLVRYLTESCRLMDAEFSVTEADILIQTNTGLEFIDSCYYIKPRWLAIFRRIQHWRLNNLTAGTCSIAYFLGRHIDAALTTVSPVNSNSSTPYAESKAGLGHEALYSVSNKLSFDEILKYCFKAPLPSTEQMSSMPIPERPSSVANDGGCTSGFDDDNASGVGGGDDSNDANDVIYGSTDKEHSRIVHSFNTDNRLEILLEQCNRVQDMIAEKLALYS